MYGDERNAKRNAERNIRCNLQYNGDTLCKSTKELVFRQCLYTDTGKWYQKWYDDGSTDWTSRDGRPLGENGEK